MSRAVIIKNVASLYREPSTDSERVSQAIFGQPAVIQEARDNWRCVETWDAYHGWIEARWFQELPVGQPDYASTGRVATVRSLIADVFDAPSDTARILTKVVVSTELELIREESRFCAIRLLSEKSNLAFVRSGDVRVVDKSAASLPLSPAGEELTAEARRFIGVPYLWGGTTPFGLDCSGFVQLVFRICGVALPRDAGLQAEELRGRPVARGDLKPGDLVFFARGKLGSERIVHVGLSLGGDDFIHSAGEVGVTESSLREDDYRSIYWGGKRILG